MKYLPFSSNPTASMHEAVFNIAERIYWRRQKVHAAAVRAIEAVGYVAEEVTAVPTAANLPAVNQAPEVNSSQTAAGIANFTHAVDNPLQEDRAAAARHELQRIYSGQAQERQ